jgi:DNA-binding response OmpR family regulator
LGTRKKILLVDDERAILNLLSIKLRVTGYDVVTAVNGEKALQLIKSENPDLMLLDVIMPGISGLEVLEKTRSHSKMPIIVLSARPDNSQKALALGANFFISKPFDIDDLVDKIEKLMAN